MIKEVTHINVFLHIFFTSVHQLLLRNISLYEVASRNSWTSSLKKDTFTLFKSGRYPLRNSPLGMYTSTPAPLPHLKSIVGVVLLKTIHPAILFGHHLRNKAKSKARSDEYRGCGRPVCCFQSKFALLWREVRAGAFCFETVNCGCATVPVFFVTYLLSSL